MTKQREWEFQDEPTQRVPIMARLLAQIEEDGPADATFSAFRRQGHNLKGTAASFGYPVVSLIAHRLETYLNDMRQWDQTAAKELYLFVDRMSEMLDRAVQPNDDEIDHIVRGLPAQAINRPLPQIDLQQKVVEIMLVTPTRTIAKLLSQQIIACGFRV